MPLLQTKLHPPYQQMDRLILRPRLHKQLSQSVAGRLTLVAAPAGFGKTALVCNWLYAEKQTAAWISLDAEDNDVARFLRYVVAALHQTYPQIGRDLVRLADEAALDPPEPFLARLIHEMEEATAANAPATRILILDDYHLISNESIHGALRYLLEHLPRSLHLILTTRSDPPFPLARMRVRQQLHEIRADALRFLPHELESFFHQSNPAPLTPALVEQLLLRTEGWAAGMQLAGLTLQGLDAAQAEQFITTLGGTDRYISDYLLDEVLLRQPDEVRAFLLQTSILERLSPALCDAVTGQKNGRDLLRRLEAGNFFLLALDHTQQWYRYHHLFLDLLRAQLHYQQPEVVVELHRRACDWYAAHDLIADALHHAFAAEDFARAANLIESTWRAMDRTFQSATWLGWARRLPQEQIRCRPVLSAGYGWALLDTGEFESADPYLCDAERWLDAAAGGDTSVDTPVDTTEMIVVDYETFQSLPATLAAARAYLAYGSGDLAATRVFAQRALALLPPDDPFYRGIPAVTLGLAYWADGDLIAAHRAFADAVVDFQRAENALFAINGLYVMAEILVAQGRLREALGTYERALRLAGEQRSAMSLVRANLHRGISEIYDVRGDPQSAGEHLTTSQALYQEAMQSQMGFRFYIAQARIQDSAGDLDAALALLQEAERVYRRDRMPDVAPIGARKVRVWIRQGRLVEALIWVRERGVSMADDLSYRTEFEHMTLARILFKQASSEQAVALDAIANFLQRLLEAAEAGERRGSVIEVLVLLALVHQEQGDISTAIEYLAQALTLARTEEHVRLFVDEGVDEGADEGAAIVPLLRRAASQGIEPEYVASLLAILQIRFPSVEQAQPLIEPLSPRELELLHLVADGLSNQQISQQLIISIATTKKHMSNILGKLSANNRTEAVRRAQNLKLI